MKTKLNFDEMIFTVHVDRFQRDKWRYSILKPDKCGWEVYESKGGYKSLRDAQVALDLRQENLEEIK